MSLYTSEYHENEALLRSSVGSGLRVSKETNPRLDRPLQLDEPHAEVYRAFWDIVAPNMLEAWPRVPCHCRYSSAHRG